MNVAYKKTNCLSNIPERDGKIAHPRATTGMTHVDRMNIAAAIAIVRYKKTIEELAKV